MSDLEAAVAAAWAEYVVTGSMTEAVDAALAALAKDKFLVRVEVPPTELEVMHGLMVEVWPNE